MPAGGIRQHTHPVSIGGLALSDLGGGSRLLRCTLCRVSVTYSDGEIPPEVLHFLNRHDHGAKPGLDHD